MNTRGVGNVPWRLVAGIAVRVVFVVSNLAIVVFVLNWTALHNAYRLYANRERVEHTREVRQEIRGVYVALLEAESASRGYVIAQDSSFSARFDAAVRATWTRLGTLARLTADNGDQRARITRLHGVLSDKFAFLKTVMETGARGPGQLARGQALLHESESILGEMDAEEMRLYFARDGNMKKTIGYISNCMYAIMIRDVIALVVIVSGALRAWHEGWNGRGTW